MNALIWYLRYWFRLLNWPGLLGVAGIVAAVVFAWLGWQARQESGALEAQLAMSKRKPVSAAVASPPDNPRVWLLALPGESEVAHELHELYQLAEQQGLEVDQGQYRLSTEKDAPVLRYRMTLPVTGSYPQIRAWLSESLRHLPALTLADFQMERETIESTDLDATVQFDLFLEQGR